MGLKKNVICKCTFWISETCDFSMQCLIKSVCLCTGMLAFVISIKTS